MSSILKFPNATLEPSGSTPKHTSTSTSQDALNRPRRLHLYDPTQETLTHRALDLASQIGIAVSRIDHEIANSTTRDRLRRRNSETSCNA